MSKTFDGMIVVSMGRIYLKNKIFTIEYLKEPNDLALSIVARHYAGAGRAGKMLFLQHDLGT